jgi:ribosome maturation protein SDO1
MPGKDIRKAAPEELLEGRVIARLESHGDVFEVLVEEEAVQQMRSDKEVDLLDKLAADTIFSDVKKGIRASEEKMVQIFGTDEVLTVAETIIKKGDIQVTTEQRRRLTEEKRLQIINIIARNAINPQTGAPHPPLRIENAMKEARVNIDPFKSADAHIQTVLDALRPLIPIRFEEVKIAVKLSAEDCPRCYGDIKSYGKIVREEWQSNGMWIGLVEIPAGLQTDFLERLNQKTKGNVETKIVK